MSKYIVNHFSKVIHRSSYVCDDCKVPSYESHMREDIEDDSQIDQLTDFDYTKCDACFELDLISSSQEREKAQTRTV